MMGRAGVPQPSFAALALVAGTTIHAAPLQDLNFEQATIVLDPSLFLINADDALPGWTVTEDGDIQSAVVAGVQILDETSVTLVTSVALGALPPGDPIQGVYSVQLYSYVDAPPGYYRTASISQTGEIPADAKTILFEAQSPFDTNFVPFVSFDGTAIDVFPISTSGGVITMAGDVSSFAGDTGELAFTAAGVPGSHPGDEDVYNLDDISFSPNPIPEPASAALLLAALPLLAIRRRRA